MSLLAKLSSLIIAGVMSLGFVQPSQAPTVHSFGAAVPSTPALYDSYLASGISKTDTTMTLATGVLRNGDSLSGRMCFTLDVNQPTVEYVCGTASGATVTNLERGVDVLDPTSTSSNLAYSHRRFASATISDYPTIQVLSQKVNGSDTLDTPLAYSDSVSTTTVALSDQNLASVGLLNSYVFGTSIPPASETAAGFVELATGLEAASTTSSGSTARLVLPASIATSTYNSATANLKVVMTQNNGKIDPSFVSTTTLFVNSNLTGTTTLATTTIIGSFPAYQIGKNIAVITSTQSFTIPSGVKMLKVELIGGGGGTCGGNNEVIAGAGGGGYALKYVDVSATSSVYVTIGAGGSGGSAGSCITHLGTTGGTTSFGTFFSATGGNANSDWNVAGSGGTGSGGDFNSYGQSGTLGNGVTGGSSKGGSGGGSTYGGGGIPGSSGNVYGGGGGGVTTAGTAGGTGGAAGVAIITW